MTERPPPGGVAPRRGLFITFEGMDGCGKTTQMQLLAERLRREGYPLLVTAEPGGTPIGLQIRRILLDTANQELTGRTELLLYFACRAQNVEQWILPALAEGRIVLSDRFTDSTMAYQGFARGLGEDAVATLDRIACQGLRPDLTLLLDIDLETSLARARTRNQLASQATMHIETRMEEQAAEFYQRARDGYFRIAAREPERFSIIDGRREAGEVAAAVWEAVAPALESLHV